MCSGTILNTYNILKIAIHAFFVEYYVCNKWLVISIYMADWF